MGILPSEDLRRTADEALTRGVYSYSLAELAAVSNPIISDIEPLFLSALKELGIPLPQKEEAVLTVLESLLRSIAEGEAQPHDGLRRVMREVYYGADLYEKSVKYTGDSHGIHHLIGCYWAYDDLRERPDEVDFDGKYGEEAIAGLDAQVVHLATEWIVERNRGRVMPNWLAWNDGAVRKMAQAIHDDRRFSDLPLLADALEEAGCCDMEILEHCREQAPHVFNCWVVQLLLAAG